MNNSIKNIFKSNSEYYLLKQKKFVFFANILLVILNGLSYCLDIKKLVCSFYFFVSLVTNFNIYLNILTWIIGVIRIC